jgi:cytochrome b
MSEDTVTTEIAAAGVGQGPATVRVWDRFVRVFHWTVVAGCGANLLVLQPGSLPHQVVGYSVVGLVLLRIIWGFIGSRHARFSDFVPGPATLFGYLKALAQGREPRVLGHNPAAAVMILALMAMLLSLGVTGWMSVSDTFSSLDWPGDVHEALANLLLAMVLVHAGAAVIESLRHRENLILSMITGRKRA